MARLAKAISLSRRMATLTASTELVLRPFRRPLWSAFPGLGRWRIFFLLNWHGLSRIWRYFAVYHKHTRRNKITLRRKNMSLMKKMFNR
jgi:hypothetical protein